jgi:hemolysin III
MELAIRTVSTTVWGFRPSEEGANLATHGLGLVFSVAGAFQLLAATEGRGTAGQVIGTAIFGGSMVGVYLASSLYHAAQDERRKKRLQIIDHAAIYLMIAGTYTPFLLALPDPWPNWVLPAIWCLAALGVGFKARFGSAHQRLSMMTYLAIGWIGLLAIRPLVEHVSLDAVGFLLSGGLAYTIGTVFFVRRDIRYSHAIWHVFVLLGSALHYSAVILCVIPQAY